MEEILQNPTSETLADAVKHNLYAFFHRIQRNYPLRTGTESGLVTWQTALPHPWFNAVLSTQPPGEEAPVTIQEVLEEFASRGVESISWWLAPELQPETWEVFLLNAGFARDSNTPGMAVKLENLERRAMLDGFEIQLVEDRPALKTWTQTFGRGYGLPEAWDEDLCEMIASLGLSLPFQNYLGFQDGESVSAATMFLGAGVAGIYNVATLEKARGKGIGSLMTANPLLKARQMGYQWGILQSSQMGYGVYRRLGFEKVCDMEHYYCQIQSRHS